MTLRQAQDRSFGEAAAKLSAAASQLLGWRPDEFWNATPAELALAFQPPSDAVEAPNAKTIAQLRERFPD